MSSDSKDTPPDKPARKPINFRVAVVHSIRVTVLIAIGLCMHLQHRQQKTADSSIETPDLSLDDIQSIFPEAISTDDASSEGWVSVRDASENRLGFVVQTSPQANHVSGFSGPTNVLICFDPDEKISRLKILSSGDTRDHVQQIRDDNDFLASWRGMTWEEASRAQVDAVSGATLTSYAIVESVIERLGGSKPNLLFPIQLNLEQARLLFPDLDFQSLRPRPPVFEAKTGTGTSAKIISTSPAADKLIGYQGPTQSYIATNSNGKIIHIQVAKSYDNEPYVSYVRDDEYFLNLFNGLTINELATLDLEEFQVEGVSGATITSMNVAEGIKRTATDLQNLQEANLAVPPRRRSKLLWSIHDLGSICIVLIGIVLGLTSLRGNNKLRILFQVTVIGYLGFYNGALISQVMLVGWAQNGIPWFSALGLVVLTLAAFAIPVFTKRNVYCDHLCPHGALQQIIKNRTRYKIHLSRSTRRTLGLIPAVLLTWVVLVTLLNLPFNLVDIEPFDAYLIRIAGVASIVIAVVGLVASLFVPMAYCHFGCPTGALLNFTRLNARSDRLGPRDWLALTLLAVAVLILIAK